jgi:hypothetical protein
MTAVSLIRRSAMLAEWCVSVVPNRRESRRRVTFGVCVERVLNWREGRRLGGVENKTLGTQAEASGEGPCLPSTEVGVLLFIIEAVPQSSSSAAISATLYSCFD